MNRREVDERYDLMARCFSDALDFVFFNQSFPTNQQVRKTIKKSDLVEFRISAHDWDPVESKNALPRIQHMLETVLNVQYTEIPKLSTFKDLLYRKTKRGSITESQILEKYNGPPMECTQENYERFVKDIESLCNLFQYSWLDSKASEVREYIMNQAKACDIKHFTLRQAEDLFQSQLKRFTP